MPSFLNLPHALTADPSTLVRRGVDGGIFVGPLSIVGPFTLDGDLLFTPDNTHDIGAVAASRPRDIFVARNGNFGGRLQLSIPTTDGLVLDSGLTGSPRVFFMNVTPTGWVIMNQSGGLSFRGDDGSPGVASGTERMRLTNAALVLSAGVAATIGGNLIFSADNSFDIGASGASRPRDLFMSRALTVGGNSLLGAITPATGSPRLDIVGSAPQMVCGQVETDASLKSMTWGVRHFTNAEEAATVINAFSQSGANFVDIGGGSGVLNAATTLRFFTAANQTTLSGTLAAEITGVGASSRFHAVGNLDVAGILSVGAVSTRAKLVVTGFVATDNGAFGFLDVTGGTGTSSGVINTSIFADNRIVGQEINANSDARIKENVTPLKGALELIRHLRVVGYNKLSKSGPAMGEYGLIGQELTEVLPLALRVSPGDVPDGQGGWKEVNDFHQINYQTVFMLAIRAIQEQQVRIEALEAAAA